MIPSLDNLLKALFFFSLTIPKSIAAPLSWPHHPKGMTPDNAKKTMPPAAGDKPQQSLLKVATIIASCLTCIAVLLIPRTTDTAIERSIQSMLFTLRGPRTAPDSVVMIRLDQQAFNEQNNGDTPSALVAKATRRLTELGAKAIVFDLVFQSEDSSGVLQKALTDAPSVIGYFTEPQINVSPKGKKTVSISKVLPAESFRGGSELIDLRISAPKRKSGAISLGLTTGAVSYTHLTLPTKA